MNGISIKEEEIDKKKDNTKATDELRSGVQIPSAYFLPF
jgi:hypothetical protein